MYENHPLAALHNNVLNVERTVSFTLQRVMWFKVKGDGNCLRSIKNSKSLSG